MSITKNWIYILILLLAGMAVLVGSNYLTTKNSATVENQIHIKWLLAHQPAELFLEATEIFTDELAKNTNNSFSVEVLLPGDVNFFGDVPTAEVLKLLDSGEIQLATTNVVGIGEQIPSFGIVSLPFLFKNFESAERFHESAVSKQILEDVTENSSVHALAFTYSGGFKIIASKNKEIKGIDDFKGLRISTGGGFVSEEIIRQLGAIPVPIESVGKVDLESIDAVETTYTRISPTLGDNTFVKYINETNHSLFLTVMITSQSFYDSLSSEDRLAFEKAARIAAAKERADSIALGEETKEKALEQGIVIVSISDEVTAELRSRLVSVYKKFESIFGAERIESILNLQN